MQVESLLAIITVAIVGELVLRLSDWYRIPQPQEPVEVESPKPKRRLVRRDWMRLR